MTPHEFWLLVDGKRRAARAASGQPEKMTREDLDEMIADLRAKGVDA
jgi:hypothetical protein